MKKFIIHVIDEISNYIDNNGKFEIIPFDYIIDENDENVYILHTDAIYLSEGSDEYDAVSNVMNLIEVRDEYGDDVPLSDFVKNSYNKNKDVVNNSDDDSLSTMDIEEDETPEVKEEVEEDKKTKEIELKSNYNRSINTISKLIPVVCQIKRENGDDKWVEIHKISFYAIEDKKIIQATIENK